LTEIAYLHIGGEVQKANLFNFIYIAVMSSEIGIALNFNKISMASQKVLIIDDGKTIRMQVRDMLPKGAFEVLEAKDGVEGLTLIRQERPNLILLDFFMPRMNGWEVLEQMQAQPELKTIPLVVMSGRKQEVTERIPHLMEQLEFIEKPFEQKALIDAVKSAMAKARVKHSAAAQPQPVAAPAAKAPAGDEVAALKAEIRALNEKTAKMQAEFDNLKKQMNQIMAFVKQRLN